MLWGNVQREGGVTFVPIEESLLSVVQTIERK